MVFTVEEIRSYLTEQTTIERALENLSEQAIVDCINVVDFKSLNYSKNDENLTKYETKIGMAKQKELQRTMYRNSNGKKGRYWLACSPKWIESDFLRSKTDYEIIYWVNYGDNMTYGYFTVEQIIQWFHDPKIFLHEIGGTKER